ncbi:hypothetical protein [Nafulsella turpanensis]|uniref:hypothetical protein n=1 Tax=Nafulsella turpanensis TaxID=1265690 RepID=UPI00034B8261|nr:hypothetical protein [Nafulsella turpanensis]
MGFFDFLKRKQLADYYDQPLIFNVDHVFRKNLSEVEKGDYVKLWTKPEMDRILIYGSGSVGGDGKIGDVPNKYVRVFQKHLLSAQNIVDIHGFSPSNYDAKVIEVSPTHCQLLVTLHSPEAIKQRVESFNKEQQEKLKDEFSKKYKMKKPVEIRFNQADLRHVDLHELQVKIFDKEFYLNRGGVLIQLVDQNNNIITDASSQGSTIIRVIKGYYNGQQMEITEMNKTAHGIKVKIGPKQES